MKQNNKIKNLKIHRSSTVLLCECTDKKTENLPENCFFFSPVYDHGCI